jgi:hypothetical protein
MEQEKMMGRMEKGREGWTAEEVTDHRYGR